MIDPVLPKLWTRDFILMCLSNFLMFVAFYFLIPTLPVYLVERFHANKSQVGIILASYTLAALLIRPFTGVAVDSYGRKVIFLVFMAIFALLFNVYIIAGSLLLIFLLRFMHGFTWGVTTTASNTVIVDIIPAHRRGEGIGVFGLSFTVAMALGPFLGILISRTIEYRLMFFVAFLIGLGGWILAMNVRFPHYQPHKKSALKLANLFEKTSLPVSLILMLVNITYGGIISFIAIYGLETGIKDPSMYFLVYAIAVSLTRFGSGKFFNLFGPEKLMIAGLLFMGAGFPVLALLKGSLGFHFSAVLMGLGGGVIMPTCQTMVNNMVPAQKRGAANSTLFTALDLGIGIGMVFVGFIAEMTSLTTAFIWCTTLFVLAGILYYSFVQSHYDRHRITTEKEYLMPVQDL